MTFDEATDEIFRLLKRYSDSQYYSSNSVSRVLKSDGTEHVYVYAYTKTGSINVYCSSPNHALEVVRTWLGIKDD